jgi:S-formylglutathione hydrolase FrmB
MATLCALVVSTTVGLPARPARAEPPSAVRSIAAAELGARYERITIHGTALEGNLEGDVPDRKVSIYLPSGYSKNVRRRRYPVLYILHGFGESDDTWFRDPRAEHSVNLPRAVDEAFAQGVREMIVVVPDAHTKLIGSMYSSSPVTGDWETFVTRDLVSYIDSHYRTLARPESRGLAGYSMGGYGAVRIGMKHPHVFSSWYAMSPCCMAPGIEPQATVLGPAFERASKVKSPDDLSGLDFLTLVVLSSSAAWSPNPQRPPFFFDLPVQGGKPVPDVIAAWVANSPIAMLPQYIPNLKTYQAIAFEAGDQDAQTGIEESIRLMDRLFTLYGISHDAEIYEGNHLNRIQERLTTKVLPFFSLHLKF